MVKNVTIKLIFVSVAAQISFPQEGDFPCMFQASPNKQASPAGTGRSFVKKGRMWVMDL